MFYNSIYLAKHTGGQNFARYYTKLFQDYSNKTYEHKGKRIGGTRIYKRTHPVLYSGPLTLLVRLAIVRLVLAARHVQHPVHVAMDYNLDAATPRRDA
jgi:hypothetical protein